MSRIGADELLEAVTRIAQKVAAPAADDVDRDARFPRETLDALKEAGLLSALVPVENGGMGATLQQVAFASEILGRACASSAMIFAMHQIQVACLVRHGRTPELQQFQVELADRQLLLASATTEVGIGGDTRSSSCAVLAEGSEFTLRKQAPVISYAEYADAIFVTARRTPDSAPSDQVLVVCPAGPRLALEPTGEWNTLGFRGTCSPGFVLEASGSTSWIMPGDYADISAQTMLPVAHILWSHLWFGMADTAVDTARRFVRKAARSNPGNVPPGAMRLAELMELHLQFAELVHGAAARYMATEDDPASRTAPAFALSMNTVKVAASGLLIDVVGKAMLVTGIMAYREDTEFRLGRVLRDAYGASLMVNNDRILTNNARLLLVSKD